jgi:hypothetical protein
VGRTPGSPGVRLTATLERFDAIRLAALHSAPDRIALPSVLAVAGGGPRQGSCMVPYVG